ncbi:MAG: copper transporter [Actinomycetota bacterium]|nr:copper transporter [Actinomycetota bacterium]
MIDFRYHIVSIVAIFLALTIGIVVGTTALNGPVLDDLRGRVSVQARDKRTLEGQVRALQGQVGSDQTFVSAVAPLLVTGRLAGQRVVVISAPGASDAIRDGVVNELRLAGAQVSARVKIRGDYVAPDKAAALDDLVSRLAPAGIALTGATVGERAGAELAAALVGTADRRGSLSNDAATTVLAGFQAAGLLTVEGDPPTMGTLGVAIVGPAPDKATPADTEAVKALLALVGAMDARSGGAVLAGPREAASGGGAIAALRADAKLSANVSTVDGADSAIGAVATVFSLRGQLRGESGQYGTGPGASAPLPVPTVSPSAGT